MPQDVHAIVDLMKKKESIVKIIWDAVWQDAVAQPTRQKQVEI
jgi:hypothetical protein